MFKRNFSALTGWTDRRWRPAMFRPRHTMVLAAVGWCLILPSPKFARNDAYKQPLNRWQVVQTFDDQDSCEQFKDNFFDSSRQERSVGVLNPEYRDYMFAKCVATDDPRMQTGAGQPLAAGSGSLPPVSAAAATQR